MKRVAKPGDRLAFIEPDFSVTTINLPNRPLLRRALAQEVDTVMVNSWLPGPLLGMLKDEGLNDIRIDTRGVIFPQDMGAEYFSGVGRHAREAGVISEDELTEWLSDLEARHAEGRIFATAGYFLFTARV